MAPPVLDTRTERDPDRTLYLEAVARGVRVVAWLLACPRGETRAALGRRFGWSASTVDGLLAALVPQRLVYRVGRRYRAAPDATTLATPPGRRSRARGRSDDLRAR